MYLLTAITGKKGVFFLNILRGCLILKSRLNVLDDALIEGILSHFRVILGKNIKNIRFSIFLKKCFF
jgi:hypothetical protein